jgi:uncharacterized membrane protein
MIAVALIPPAATVGIGLAWGQPFVIVGSAVLLLVNVLSINLAALVALWYSGYRPEHWFRQSDAKRSTVTRVAVLTVGIVVLSAFLGGVTYDSYQRATTTDQIESDAAAEIEAFDDDVDLELLEVEVEYASLLPLQPPEQVIVTVGVPPGESVTGLAGVIGQRVAATTGHTVEIDVRYVGVERHHSPSGSSGS